MRLNNQDRDGGFTLIEALVVLTISALAIALVPAAMSLGQRALMATAALEKSTADSRALSVVVARISAARPLFAAGADGLTALAFEGRPDRIGFVSEFGAGPSGGGLYWAELHIDAERSTLVLDVTPYPVRNGQASTATRTVLLPASAMAVRYFGTQPRTGTAAWQQEWKREAANLPKMIEISFTRPGATQPPRSAIISLHLAP
jgi:prepilin-type N-terminal cleavage/methylation domain-containing protein